VSIETSADATVASFNVSGSYTNANFKVSKDVSGDVLVSYVAAATASQAIIGSPADVLGGHAAEFAEPSWTQASNLSAFDSWSALASGPGTSTDGFGFPYENDGYGRDAHGGWGVAVGSEGPTGHGPGASS
jgi:hypothetical protein